MSDHLEFLKSDDPFKIFENWFSKAKKEEQNPTAFTLSTVDENNFPDARTLLLNERTKYNPSRTDSSERIIKRFFLFSLPVRYSLILTN